MSALAVCEELKASPGEGGFLGHGLLGGSFECKTSAKRHGLAWKVVLDNTDLLEDEFERNKLVSTNDSKCIAEAEVCLHTVTQGGEVCGCLMARRLKLQRTSQRSCSY